MGFNSGLTEAIKSCVAKSVVSCNKHSFCFSLCEHLQLLKKQTSLPLSQTIHKMNYARIDDVQKQVTELCGNRLTYRRKCEGPTFSY